MFPCSGCKLRKASVSVETCLSSLRRVWTLPLANSTTAFDLLARAHVCQLCEGLSRMRGIARICLELVCQRLRGLPGARLHTGQLRCGRFAAHAQGAGGACLNDVLVLAMTHAILPWNPVDCARASAPMTKGGCWGCSRCPGARPASCF